MTYLGAFSLGLLMSLHSLTGSPGSLLQSRPVHQVRPPEAPPSSSRLACIGWLFGFDIPGAVHWTSDQSVKYASLDAAGLDSFPFPGFGAESGEEGMIAVYSKRGSWLLVRSKGRYGWINRLELPQEADVRFVPIEKELDRVRVSGSSLQSEGWTFEGLVLALKSGRALIYDSPDLGSRHRPSPRIRLGTRTWIRPEYSFQPAWKNTRATGNLKPHAGVPFRLLERRGDWLKVQFPKPVAWQVKTPPGGDPSTGNGVYVRWDLGSTGWILWRADGDLLITSELFGTDC